VVNFPPLRPERLADRWRLARWSPWSAKVPMMGAFWIYVSHFDLQEKYSVCEAPLFCLVRIGMYCFTGWIVTWLALGARPMRFRFSPWFLLGKWSLDFKKILTWADRKTGADLFSTSVSSMIRMHSKVLLSVWMIAVICVTSDVISGAIVGPHSFNRCCGEFMRCCDWPPCQSRFYHRLFAPKSSVGDDASSNYLGCFF